MKRLLTSLLAALCFVAFGDEAAHRNGDVEELIGRLSARIPEGWVVARVDKSKAGAIQVQRQELVAVHLAIPSSSGKEPPREMRPAVVLSPRPFVSREQHARLSHENAQRSRQVAGLRARLAAVPTRKSVKPTVGPPHYLPRGEQERRLVEEATGAIAAVKFHELPGYYYGNTAYDVWRYPRWPIAEPAQVRQEFDSALRIVRTVLRSYAREGPQQPSGR
ncbi:MAG: hypothetical protein HN904_16680 [Victivallales bacterium]|jgi:hypothetical protein|nr:hypothetical protein [Victivallales bacterium]